MLHACSIAHMTEQQTKRPRPQWRVAGPTTFDLAQFETGDWHTIEDASGVVSNAIHVRVANDDSGRVVLTGLVLEDEPLTSSALRDITLGDVVRAIADHDAALRDWRSGDAPAPEFLGEIGPTGLARFEGMTDQISETTSTSVVSKRGHAVSDDDLRTFAETYRGFSGYPNQMQRTYRALNIERSTAYRWLKRCESKGYLPAQTDNEGENR